MGAAVAVAAFALVWVLVVALWLLAMVALDWVRGEQPDTDDRSRGTGSW